MNREKNYQMMNIANQHCKLFFYRHGNRNKPSNIILETGDGDEGYRIRDFSDKGFAVIQGVRMQVYDIKVTIDEIIQNMSIGYVDALDESYLLVDGRAPYGYTSNYI